MANIDVYLGKPDAEISGSLEAKRSRHVFSYHHDAPEALSLTMPLRLESYPHDGLHPIFQMNLPEGALREGALWSTTLRIKAFTNGKNP